ISPAHRREEVIGMKEPGRRKFVKSFASAVALSSLAVAGEGKLGEKEQPRKPVSVPPFPSVSVSGVTLPRLIIGTNSLLGWSHTSLGRDRWIRQFYTPERISDVFVKCLEFGLTAVFGPCYQPLLQALEITEKRTGIRLTFIGTTLGDPAAIREQIRQLKDAGAKFCLLHGGWADSFPIENGRIKDFDRFFAMVREAGMIPGTSCHKADRLQMIVKGGYDCEVVAVPVNKIGFYMHPSREAVLQVLNECTKPVIAIKPLASGRFDENRIEDWLRWTFSVKGVVAAAVGFMNAEEAEEDAAIVRRIFAAV
ncbi:MAG: hypothetical protein N2116_06990, partial [Armatimonadetes bacterium]|nr:hypothetical protein [Armatimonadota bacterium]